MSLSLDTSARIDELIFWKCLPALEICLVISSVSFLDNVARPEISGKLADFCHTLLTFLNAASDTPKLAFIVSNEAPE